MPTSAALPSAPSVPTVRVVRTLEELEPLRADWSALQWHPQSDLDFYREVLARRASFLRPHVLVLERDGRVEALIAGQLLADSIPWRVGPLRLFRTRARVQRLGAGAILGRCDEAGARSALQALQASLAAGEADAVYLHQLAHDAPFFRAAQRAPGLARDRFARTVPGWSLALPGSFEEFLASRSRAVRKNYRRYASRIEHELGDLHVACHRAPGDLERILAESTAIARRTYHERLGVAFRDDAETRALLAHALQAGWFECHVLYRGAQPIAFAHGLVYRETLFARDTGFDPAYADYRPGIYLLGRMIAGHCAAGTRTLDYGVMDAEYKRQFGSARAEYASAFVFGASARGRVLALKRAVVGSADRLVRATLGSERARRWSRRLRHPLRT